MSKFSDIWIDVKPDFSKATDGEKRLYVEYLVRKGRLTKDIVDACLKELNVSGRTKILQDLPTRLSWNLQSMPQVQDSIKEFCRLVPAEVIVRHIVRKATTELNVTLSGGILFTDKGSKVGEIHPEFSILVNIENNVIGN